MSTSQELQRQQQENLQSNDDNKNEMIHVTCSACGETSQANARFCSNCGAEFPAVGNAELVILEEQIDEDLNDTEKSAKKVEKLARKAAKKEALAMKKAKKAAMKAAKKAQQEKRKWPIILAVVLLLTAAAAATVAAIKLLPLAKIEQKEKPHNYAAYLKDGELFYSDLTQDGKTEISAQLEFVEEVGSAAGRFYGDGRIEHYTTFADGGKRIFFPDKLNASGDTDGIYLYWRDIDKPEEDARQIDSEVTAYAVNTKGDRVIYLKGEDGNLYVHDLTDRQKIAAGVKEFMVADDCGKVGFLTEENAVYLWTSESNEKNKLASDVSEIVYVADDFSVFYYLKDESLYKQTQNSDDREKIANGVVDVLAVYETGELYYTTNAEKEWHWNDFVEDDMAEADAAITEPSEPNYPSKPTRPSSSDYRYWSDYYDALDRYEANLKTYNDKVEKLRSDYNSEKEAYQQRLERDSLRDSLKGSFHHHGREVLTLNYYNGTESAVVVKEYYEEETVNQKNPIVFVSCFDLENVAKVKFSELIENFNFTLLSPITNAVGNSIKTVLVVGGTAADIEHEHVDNMVIAEDGSMACFVVSERGEDGLLASTGDLYKINISDGLASEPEVMDTDVERWYVHFIEGNHLVYYKNCDGSKGDLYLDGMEIDYDVTWGQYKYCENGTLVYQADWDMDSGASTLKIYKEGTRHTVADDVQEWVLTESGNILYLHDYNTKYKNGTLSYYDGENTIKLDEDVESLIEVSESEIKGYFRE